MKISNGTISAIAILASLFASSTIAQSVPASDSASKSASKISTYVGGNFSLYSGGEDACFSAGTIRGGIMFTLNFGAEIEYSVSVRRWPPCVEGAIPTRNVLTSARKEVEVGRNYIGA